MIIPALNTKELMLKDEVIDAVKNKQFHIYPITRVEEGIEILTSTKAGKRGAKGYEKNLSFISLRKRLKICT